jgi:hypothetical protein
MYRSFCGLIRPLCSKVMGKKGLKTVLWIRIGFNEDSDPDPAFYIRIRIQGATPMRIRIRILVILSSHKKLNFYMTNILRVGNRSKRFCGGRAFFICKSVELYSSFRTNAKASLLDGYCNQTTFSTSMVKGYCCYIAQYVLLW